MVSSSRASSGGRLRQALRAHRGALLVGALFMALSLFYNVSTPLWEADNEWPHYNYVRYIVDNRTLPRPDSPMPFLPSADECHSDQALVSATNLQFRQPPLYYLLGAAASFWVDTRAGPPLSANPYVFTDPSRAGYNFALHPPAEALPYRGAVLAVHVVRLLSGFIGLAGLVATYLAGLLLFAGRRSLALAMMAVNAFIPQYVFSSATINNDILAGALGSWCVFLCLNAGLSDSRLRILTLAAVAAGLAIMTKYNGVALAPVVVAAAALRLLRAWQEDRKRFGTVLWRIGAVLGMASAPFLLWLGRNKLLYDQFIVRYPALTAPLARTLSPLVLRAEGQETLHPLRAGEFAFMTFWGLFGADTVALPPPILVLLTAICLLALAGLTLYLLDRRQSRSGRVLAVLALLFVLETWGVSLVKAVGTSEPRGRYLMPAFSTVSFLLVLGIDRLSPAPLKTTGRLTLCLALLALSVAVPPLVLQPVYAPPPLAAEPALHEGEEPLHAIFGDFAELVGYRLEPGQVSVFEKLEVTLVWRALRQTPNNYTVGIHLLDGGDIAHGSLATYPGRGNFATSLWQPGNVFRDTYALYLNPSARQRAPSRGQVKVALFCFHPDGDRSLEVTNQQGDSLGDAVYLGRFKLAPESEPPHEQPAPAPLFSFGEEIALESFRIEPDVPRPGQEEASIVLRWRALKQPAADYSLFAHLVDKQGKIISGNDQPLTDSYYPSGLWAAGETITHTHRIRIPAILPIGAYDLTIGLYDPQTGLRLPALKANNERHHDDRAVLKVYEFSWRNHFLPYVSIGPRPELQQKP